VVGLQGNDGLGTQDTARSPATDAKTGCQNSPTLVWTVSARRRPSTNFSDVSTTAIHANTTVTSVRCEGQASGDIRARDGANRADHARSLTELLWECKFDEIMTRHPELKINPVVGHSPLNSRDSLYGGRTEVMRLHYNVREGEETVQYVEVMSLYMYVCKYFKFPVGHPVIHVGDACQDTEAMLRKEGLINCCILPPQRLYHPVFLIAATEGRSACKGRAPPRATLIANALTRRLPRGPSPVRGSSMKLGWPYRSVMRSSRFSRCTNKSSRRKIRRRVRAVSSSSI